MIDIPLLPIPKKLKAMAGFWKIPKTGIIVLDHYENQDQSDRESIAYTAKKLAVALAVRDNTWKAITHPTASQINAATIRLKICPASALPHPQGYRLSIASDGVRVEAGTVQGGVYALQTLRQLAAWNNKQWPTMSIVDWPDFTRRGFYLDVSRGKVPTRKTLLALVDQLAELKINEFQMYIENVFSFPSHPDISANTTPLSAEDMVAVDGACRRNGIDFVPSLASLGHFEKILRLPRYRKLAEVEPADLRRQGVKTWSEDPWTLCVTDRRAKKLLADMYREFLPHFTSRQFNICCDESWDLGLGRSKPKLAEKTGPVAENARIGRLYVDWVNYCAKLATEQRKTIQLWGDIIFNHPELLPELPREAVLLEWGYSAKHPFASHGELFAKNGRKFYLCPGTSTWQSFGGRTDNALKNIRRAALAGVRCGAYGLLVTDWGDHGHQQLWAVSLLPMAYGAAVAWNSKQKADAEFCKNLGKVLPLDSRGQWVDIAAELGNVYKRIAKRPLPNSSMDWQLFREPWGETKYLKMTRSEVLMVEARHVSGHIRTLENMLAQRKNGAGKNDRLGDSVALNELLFTAKIILHALERTKFRFMVGHAQINRPQSKFLAGRLLSDLRKLRKTYPELWLRRNKRSSLADVLIYFDRLAAEYQKLV